MGNSSESIERGRGIHRVVDSPAQEAVCLVDGATGEHVLPSVIVVEVARLSVPPVLEFAGLCVCACAFSVWKRAATCTYYTHRGFTTAGTLYSYSARRRTDRTNYWIAFSVQPRVDFTAGCESFQRYDQKAPLTDRCGFTIIQSAGTPPPLTPLFKAGTK